MIFNLCSKTPYGDTIFLCFAVLSMEKTRHLTWTIQCCVLNGITSDVPLFTDQEPLIAKAEVLQGDDQTTEYGGGEEADRLLKIFLNIMICAMNFIRGALHHSVPSAKYTSGIIQNEFLRQVVLTHRKISFKRL